MRWATATEPRFQFYSCVKKASHVAVTRMSSNDSVSQVHSQTSLITLLSSWVIGHGRRSPSLQQLSTPLLPKQEENGPIDLQGQ